MRARRLIARAAAAAVFAIAARGAGAFTPLDQAKTFTLENGLRVVTLHDPAQAVVAVQMLYTVGARNEPPGQTGIAHFVEHMLFRGTKKFGLDDITGVIERAGGEWHGYTHLDETTFFEAAPRALLPTLLALEADRMTSARIAPGEVEAERGAIWQEYRGYQQDPRSDLLDLTLATLFQQHPYRNNTMGWESDLAAITAEDLRVFYDRYFGPRNAVLAIAGDFDPAGIEKQVRGAFGAIPARGESTEVRTIEPPLQGSRRVELRRPGAAPALMISFLAPPPSQPRAFATLLVLDAILGRAKSLSFLDTQGDQVTGSGVRSAGRLNALLLQGLADWLGTAAAPTRYPFHWSLYATGPVAVEGALFEELRQAGGTVTADTVEYAVRELRDADLRATDSLIERAHEMAFWTAIGGLDARHDVQAALGLVSPDEVRALARSLTRDRAAIGLVTGGEPANPAPPKQPEWFIILGLERASLAAAQAATVSTPPARRDLIFDARPGMPTFALAAAISPPRDLDSPALEPLLGTLGVRMDATGPGEGALGRRGITAVSATGPAESLEPALRVLREMILRGQSVATSAPGSDSDDPEERARALLIERLPPAIAPSVALPIAVISPWKDYSVLAAVQPATEALPSVSPASGAGEASGAAALRPGTVCSAIPGLTQGRLVVAIPGDKDSEALSALRWILHHDYAGRLGRKVITDLGLAYSMDSEAVVTGTQFAWFSMAADAAALDRLVAAIDDVLARASNDINAAELAAWQSSVAGSAAVRLADPEQAADYWMDALLRGWNSGAAAAESAAARQLTLERLRAFAARALDPKRRVVIRIAPTCLAPPPSIAESPPSE